MNSMVKGFTYLAQVRDMKDSLCRVKKTELENIFLKMVIFMKAHGKIIIRKVRVR